MPTQAKITTAEKSVALGNEQLVNEAVSVSPGSNIALAISPDQIAGYTRDGADLVIQLKTGEVLRIVDFYAAPQNPAHLYLVDGEQQLVSANFSAAASDGSLAASYIPSGAAAGFAALAGPSEAQDNGGGGIGAMALLGGLAVGGGVALAAGGGGGSNPSNMPPSPPADTTAPAPANGLVINAAGTQLTGAAEAGATVRVDTDRDGVADTVATVGADGRFTVPLTPALTNGESVSVIVRDAAGNDSPPASVSAPDTTAPLPAADLQIAADGTSITGHAEPGSTVGIDTNGDGVPDRTTTTGADGSFQIPLVPPLTDGETVTVIVTDPAGNHSPPATAIAPDLVPTPLAPVINASSGTLITGSAEAGNQVTLTDGNGNPVGQATVDANGHWTITPAAPLTDGTLVTGVTTNSEGESGPPTTVTIDGMAPAAPIIDPTNGTALTGTAEAGALVTLTQGGGAAIGTATADGNGQWAFQPAAPLADGTVVNATASDAAGNVSPVATAIVDGVPPAAPLIDISNGAIVTGTAEAGVTITLAAGNGNPIGSTVASGTGNWTFTPAVPLANGTVISAVASDPAGNASPAATTTVDGLAPATPTIGLSDGTVLDGTAEAGSEITLTESGGALIGTVTADGNGLWTLPLGTPLVNGTVVNATATDAAGNASGAATVTIDSVAPVTPTILPSDGIVLSGVAEGGSFVTLTDGNGNPIGTVTAAPNGSWSFSPAVPLPDGTVVNATATDATGNVSPAASIVVDGIAPAAPTIDPSNGTTIVGTAEVGSTVTLTDGNGNLIGAVTADTNGDWHFNPVPALADGIVVEAVASDAAGNDSAAASVTVDAAAPAVPAIDPSNGTIITGTAEADARITLTDGNGGALGQVTADGSGIWSFTPGAPLSDGTIVQAVAQDASGNTSGAAAITVDGIPPAAPLIDPSNGLAVSGTAEAGSEITLTDGFVTIGAATADVNGNWIFSPTTQLANGLTVSATAQDAAGNVSGATVITVDSVAPGAPVISPSNGVNLVGTAEAGSLVTLSDGGVPIGTVRADANGNWSFAPVTPLLDAVIVSATAMDAAGNVSAIGTVTIDTSLPSIPVIDASNGSVITGTADAGDTVTLTDGNGNPIGVDIADGSGHWSVTPGVALPDGTVIQAVATNPTLTDSAVATAIVDGVAPAAPVIDLSNGTAVSGAAEANAVITLTDGNGNPIGTTVADGNGDWSFTPGVPLPHATVVNATASDAAGNVSGPGTATIDALAPAAPVINPSNGVILTGTAEAGSTVTITDGLGNAIGTTLTSGAGVWALTPSPALLNATVVNAVASDAAGNMSGPGTATIDALAPAAPGNLVVAADGTTLSGTAEANSQIRIIVNGDTANPVLATTNGSGSFTATFPTALVAGQELSVTAADAANNLSLPALAEAPDLAPPSLAVAEAADGYVNAAEIGNGIQVSVGLTAGADPGDVVNVRFVGQNGYVANQAHVITAAEKLAGTVSLTLTPPQGMAAYPQGASTITADINGGPASNAVNFTVDTVPPATPVLSLVGNILTIAGEPGSELTVDVNLGGTTATVTVTADNNGLASVDLLTGLSVGLSWDQLLSAAVSVRGEDLAGNPSNVATIGLGGLTDQIVTLGGFGLDVALLPPTLGFSGSTEPDSDVRVEIVTPAITVIVNPAVDANGDFGVNLLSPSVLSQLGLSLTGLLNLGAGLGFNVIATDSQGHDSARYGVSLNGSGLSLDIGQITISGTAGVDILSGTDGNAENINAGAGADLIFHVGTSDVVSAGDGSDTIQLSAVNFGSVDGGAGFDSLVFDNGIDIDYNGPGIGTLTNIERVDLGTGDSGSILTLTSAEVDAITDANNVLQITGEANDQLVVTGAVDTGSDVTLGGLVYDVYTFGNTVLQIEQNSVAVVH